MTNKTQIMTIMTSIALLAGFSILSAYAHDTGDTHPFSGGTHTVCIYSSNLSGVELDGSINQGSTVADIFETGMDEVSDNTDMSLTRKSTSCSGSDSIVVGWYFSDPGDKASTGPVILDTYKQIKVSTNTSANMISTGSCTGDYNMYYVANHEFGHFAGMDYGHHSNTSGHTMNEAACTSDWGQIGSGDETQIDGWY